MKTWDIAKSLIQSCNSPEEVDQILVVMRNPTEVKRVCELLTSFSAVVPADQTRQVGTRTGNAVAINGSPSKRAKEAAKKTGVAKANSSEEAIADQLELLFRNNGMTNNQVEEWVSANFNVGATVGKRSLRKYLVRVLHGADLGLKNRIIATAQQLANNQDAQDSDLVKYWDGFDKHFGTSE